jgi:drug/metabolite transporter (DMT)-like permease
MRAKRSDLLLLVLNQFIWGAGWSAIKYAQNQMGPVTLNVWSLGLSVVSLVPFLLVDRRSASSTTRQRLRFCDYRDYFIAGVIGLAGMTLLYAWGAGRSLAANGALISMSVPVVTVVVAVIVLGEKMTASRLASIGIAIAGVLLISEFRLSEVRLVGNYFFGNCLLFLGTLGNAIYVVYSKKLLAVSSAIAVLFWGQVLGLLASLPFLYFEPTAIQGIAGYTARTWLSLVFLGAIYFTATMIAFFRILTRLDAGQIMVSNYLQPVFGVLAAAVLLRERITWNMVSGGLLVLAGTALATFEGSWRARRGTSAPETAAQGQTQTE